MTSTIAPPATGLPASEAGADAAGARWGLALLVVLALYTAMDRQLIGLLAEPLRRDLGLSDTQFGLLQGAGMALFAAVAGYPLAWTADRWGRRRVLVACAAVWCAALAGCALASGFGMLLAASSLLGAAEAGLIPIAYALIADWFSSRRRQSANATFVLLGRIGGGVMMAACGALIVSVDRVRPWLPAAWQDLAEWRIAMGLTAAVGLLIVPLLLSLPRARPLDPPDVGPGGRRRLGRDPAAQAADATMPAPRAWLPLVAGGALLAGGASAVAVFMPVLVQRLGAVGPAQAGAGLGAAALAAALAALAIDRLVAWRRPGRAPGGPHAAVAAGCLGASALAAGGIAAASTATGAIVLYGGVLVGVMASGMLLVGVLQTMAPSHARARFMAVFVGLSAIAASLTPLAVGAVSDAGGATPAMLARAMAAVASACLGIAAVAVALAARRMPPGPPPRASAPATHPVTEAV